MNSLGIGAILVLVVTSAALALSSGQQRGGNWFVVVPLDSTRMIGPMASHELCEAARNALVMDLEPGDLLGASRNARCEKR